MPIRLLLCDDHRLLRDGLRRAMVDAGFDIVGVASDGTEAVALVPEVMPDVVLMDVTMPDMDGIEATTHITRDHPSVRVVLLTMHSDAGFVRSAVAAGASGFLVKDVSSTGIADAIRKVAAGEKVFAPQLAGAFAMIDPGLIEDEI